jgi:prolyl oligopeptidase
MKTTLAFASLMLSTAAIAQPEDPYLWLEDVTGDKQMAWVKEQNAASVKELEARPEFKAMHERLLAIYNSRERIPTVQKRGKWLYNFWQDAENPRGVWRRTTIEEYRKPSPAWEPVLDIGKLSADENEKWVFKGANCLYPDYTRCLVTLSRGGADAAEIREFDTVKKEFVKDGFVLKESKGSADWRDKDTLYIDRDFGPGTLTTSGYPRQVKEWKRGTPMADAKLVFEGKESDVGVSVNVIDEKSRTYEMISRSITFWESEDFIRVGDKWVMLGTPRDASVTAANNMLLVQLKSDWKLPKGTYAAGSLLAFDLDGFLDGRRQPVTLYEPKERAALRSYAVTKDYIFLDILDNVKSRIVELRRKGDRWVTTEVKVPPSSVVSVGAYDRDDSNDYWMTVTSFVEPTTLYLGHPAGESEKMKSLPAFFDAKGLKTLQYETTSKDGTKIPYFVVMREGTKLDGSNPTILYGYGGFEIPMLPNYSGTIGAGWLEKGGVWVLANLRGGGEFGPQWHTVRVAREPADGLRRFHRRGRGPRETRHHVAQAPRHHGRKPGRAAGGLDLRAAPRPLQGGGVHGAAARHAPLQQAARGRVVAGRIRQPRRSEGLGVHLEVLALPEREEGSEVPAHLLLDDDARRPRPSGTRAQDGRAHEGAGARRAVFRVHGGRPRRGIDAGAAGVPLGTHVHVLPERAEIGRERRA